MNYFEELLKTIADFILPNCCLICNKETPAKFICNNCLEYLPLVNAPFCQFCGRPITRKQRCLFCNKNMYIDHGRAWFLYIAPADKIIHHFKYRKKIGLAQLLARAMANIILSDYILRQADFIVPVPLFWLKKLKRGYNQTQLLTSIINAECKIECNDILRRVRNTKTQTRLNHKARYDNVAGAFQLRSKKIELTGKKIILIDDVMTTGATINECAYILKDAGAKEVYSCVAAITPE